jgi:alpha-ketoglutarate-dependent taurine dioxygenase
MSICFQPIENCSKTQPFAECIGIDLATKFDEYTISVLKNGLLKHGLLLFRNQKNLTPEKEVVFNRAFGWHDPTQEEFLFGFGAPTLEHKVSGGAQIPEFPQVSVLGNAFLDNYHGIRNTRLKPVLGFTFSAWHADGLHDMLDGMPELTTMYNPTGWQTSSGGATYFTSGVEAIQRMDSELYRELSCCTVAYMRAPNDTYPDETRRVTASPSFMTDEGTRRIGFGADPDNPNAGITNFKLKMEHADNGGRHPAIRAHPQTGQASLYITPGKAVYLLDTKTGVVRHGIDDTARLLSQALKPSAEPGVRYEHQWSEGDFVAWLNTLVLHSASDPDHIEGQRLMHRVRLSTPKRHHSS